MPFNTLFLLSECAVDSGPYKGAFVVAPYGYLNWYFANLGLMGFARTQPALVKAYLSLYLRSLNANATIDDIEFAYYQGGFSAPSRRRADSHDSYAATFLSLSVLYFRVSNDRAWVTANMATLKRIGKQNLLDQRKPNGLIKDFQGGTFGRFMDNAECYKGMRDFAFLLAAFKQPEAAAYQAAAQGVASGMRSLFDTRAQAYRFVDDGTAVSNKFYPDDTAQVFAQGFDVPQGDAGSTQALYNAGWSFLNRGAPNWPRCIPDPNNLVGDKDGFPWMILGFVAAKRGDTARANTQLQAVRSLTARDRAKLTINELGWYQRTVDWLAGVRY